MTQDKIVETANRLKEVVKEVDRLTEILTKQGKCRVYFEDMFMNKPKDRLVVTINQTL